MSNHIISIVNKPIRIGGKPVDFAFIKKMIPPQLSVDTWMDKCNYVRRQRDIRSNICAGCGIGKIYDKNDVKYVFRITQTMEEIKLLVEKVRKINNE